MRFRYLALSMIFMIDIRIEGIDILPDFFGYLLMLYAFINLAAFNRNFYVAKVLSMFLLILSAFDVLLYKYSNLFLLYSILQIVSSTLIGLLFLYVYNGISGIFKSSKLFKRSSVKFSFFLFFMAQLLSIVITLFSLILSENDLVTYLPMPNALLLIIIIISTIMLIKFFNELYGYCKIHNEYNEPIS